MRHSAPLFPLNLPESQGREAMAGWSQVSQACPSAASHLSVCLSQAPALQRPAPRSPRPPGHSPV